MRFREAFDKILVKEHGKITNGNGYVFIFNDTTGRNYLFDNNNKPIDNETVVSMFWENCDEWAEYKEQLKFEEGRLYKTRGGHKVKLFITNDCRNLMIGAVYFVDGWESKKWDKDGCLFSTSPVYYRDLDIVDYWE